MKNIENVKKLNAIGKLQDNLLLHSLVSHEYEIQPRDYGLKEVLGLDIRLYPIEIHLLAAINENPGISSQELAARFFRTKGAISQRIKVLSGYGLITKSTNKENHRISNLYVTEAGKLACSYHLRYDTEHYSKYLELLSSFSSEEIETCSRIILILTRALDKEHI